ncbi:MAG: hypothetical protein ACRDUA_02355 [Micromonosporaceae bacterium]
MGYEWLARALEALHGVEPYEVVQALGARRRWPVPAMSGEVKVLSIWSRTQAGRPLIVVVRPGHGLDWTILGARGMNSTELARFQRWEGQ